MTFTKLNLSGERVLIKGTDSQGTHGETVVDASEWNEVQRRTGHSQAHEDFDRAVEEFFRPITEAAEKLDLAFNQVERDPISYVVLDEGSEGEARRDEVVIKLSKDSVILRLIEEGQSDRLVWVHDELEVLEVLPGTGTVAPAAAEAGDPHADEPTYAEAVESDDR